MIHKGVSPLKYDRVQRIKQILVQEKKVVTAELSESFGVSIETIRRDLDLLESEGMIRKTYGGAELLEESLSSAVMDEWNNRCQVSVGEKKAIAEKVLTLIPDHCSLVLDSGTTTYRLACLLDQREDLSVLTNSLHCAMAVSVRSDHPVHLMGGMVKKGELITTGILACDFLDSFSKIDIAVIGVDGLTLEDGIMDYSLEMCLLKQRFLKKATKVIAITDHTKFHVRANYRSCPLERLDYLVTDSKADPEMLKEIASLGVKVLIAD